MDFYEEFFEWIMDKYPGPKDYHITLYEDSDVFDIFIEMKHPELMVADD